MTKVTSIERRADPWKAKGVALQCPNCASLVEVSVPYGITAEGRQQLISAAVGEHRLICPAASVEEGRVYQIHYPRI